MFVAVYKERSRSVKLEMSYTRFRSCWLALKQTRQQSHTSNSNAQQEKLRGVI
jgi:hypothetical protein